MIQQIKVKRQQNQPKLLPVHQSGTKILIPIRNIMYLASDRRKIILQTTEDQTEYYSTLSIEEEKLPSKQFVRIHQSYLVNFDYIKQIQGKRIVLTSGEELPISDKQSIVVKKSYLQFRGVYLNNIVLDELFYALTLTALPFIIHYFYNHCFSRLLESKMILYTVYTAYYIFVLLLHYSPLPGLWMLGLNIAGVVLLSFLYKGKYNGVLAPLYSSSHSLCYQMQLLRLCIRPADTSLPCFCLSF